jgi:hypothetical protein
MLLFSIKIKIAHFTAEDYHSAVFPARRTDRDCPRLNVSCRLLRLTPCQLSLKAHGSGNGSEAGKIKS